MKEIAPHITADPDVKLGRPVIRGTRVPVGLVLGQLASGMTIEQVCTAYELTREDVLAALAYAAKSVGDEQVRVVA